MKKFGYILVLFSFAVFSSHAEVYKCKHTSGKVSYQPSPCPTGTTGLGAVKVKEMTPEQREETKTKLKRWQEGQDAEEQMKHQAEKERQDELRKQESLELQRRSVAAQEQQMILEQQRQYQGGGSGGLYFPYNRRYPYDPRRFPYLPNDLNYFPRPHPHHPPYQSHDGMPAMPPSSPAQPIPSQDPSVPGNKQFGFR